MSNRRTYLIVSVVGAAVVGALALGRASLERDVASELDAPAQESARPTRERRRPMANQPPAQVDPRIAGQVTDPIRQTLHAPIVLEARIQEATGTPPERPGTACRLGIERTSDPTACRVVVECDRNHLHGVPMIHTTRCGFDDDDSLRTLVDEAMTGRDGDPSLAFDRALGTLTVSDDRSGPYDDYSLVLRIEAP